MSARNNRGKSSREDTRDKNTAPNPFTERACEIFNCLKSDLITFTEVQDPLNPNNKVSGLTLKKEGPFVGSLFLTHINDFELVSPQIIYGAPKINFPYQKKNNISSLDENNNNNSNFDRSHFIQFDTNGVSQYCLTNKWNGANILVFKYTDNNGNTFISAKPRATTFITESIQGNYVTLVKEALNVQSVNPPSLTLTSPHLPELLTPLLSANVQSIDFELCGRKLRHLVKYDFDIRMEPLFVTHYDSTITPVLNPRGTQYDIYGVPMTLSASTCSSEDLSRMLSKFQQDALRQNELHRQQHNMTFSMWFEHFVVEGKVLYLLGSDGNLISRDSIFKIKPSDIESSHWEQFDHGAQMEVLMALNKLFEKNTTVNEASLKQELELLSYDETAWNKFKGDILELVEGIAPPEFRAQDASPQVLVMVGIPGSGKSTIANELVKLGWERVNQDEMKTRKMCETRMTQALEKGKSVVVDRCNFDITQRHVWVKLAAKCGVTNVRCLWLDVDPQVCKERVANRKDHPTIKDAELGATIIDNFVSLLKPPSKLEGFSEITVLTIKSQTSQEEISDVLNKFSLLEIKDQPSLSNKTEKQKETEKPTQTVSANPFAALENDDGEGWNEVPAKGKKGKN